LCRAATLGKLAVARCFVEDLGADVNGADDDGITAFMKGDLSLVPFLVETLRADVNNADHCDYNLSHLRTELRIYTPTLTLMST
jgi:hypothetical protein